MNFIDPRRTWEYDEGRKAYHAGVTECPYKDGIKRRSWWTGWLDSRTNERHRDKFKQWGISFP